MTGPQGMGVLKPTGGVPTPDYWYDFSDSSTVHSTSGRIDQVDDKGGTAKHLVATSGNRPYTGRTVNGLDVADFQGDQFMRYVSPGSNLAFPTGTYTYFIAGLVDDNSSINSGILTVHNSGATSDYDNNNAFVFNNGVSGYLWAHNQAGVEIHDPGPTMLPPGVYGYRHNTGVGERYKIPTGKDVGGKTGTSIFTSGGTANGGIMIGARYSTGTVGGSAGAQRWDGTVGEIRIFGRVLTNAEMDLVYSDLTAKWGAYAATIPSYTGTTWGHWDPAVAATIASGRISQIDDLSGNGRHLVSSGSNRPFDGRTGASGLLVADYQAGQYMRANASLGTNAYTWIMAVIPDRVIGGNAGVLALCTTGTADWNNVNGMVLAETATNHWDVTANGSNAFGINLDAAGQTVVYGYRHNNGGTDRLYPSLATVGRAYGGTADQGLLLGTRWSSGVSTPFWDGAIGELLLLSTAMSDADMDAVANAMYWRNAA